MCDCEDDYSLSEDCSLTNSDVVIKQGLRLLVLQSIVDLMETEDPDEEAIVGWINLLAVATQEVDQLSAEGYQLVFNISSDIIDLAQDSGVSYSDLEVLLDALNSATKATLNSADRRRLRRLQMVANPHYAKHLRSLAESELEIVAEDSGAGLALNAGIDASLQALQKFSNLVAASLVPGQRPITSILGEF